MSFRAWAAAAVLTLPLCAQVVDQSGDQTAHPLYSLRVEGNRAIPAEKILAVCGLKTGQMVSRADFDLARQRLDSNGGVCHGGL